MSDALVSLASIQGEDEPYQRAPILFKSRPFEPCQNRQAASERKLWIFCPDDRRPKQIALQGRPRSADRTPSPAAVSQKREYFKYSPETIGDFSLKAAKSGVWRPPRNRKSPPMAGISANIKGRFS